MQIAQTILEQLGGTRFALMTGSKNFLALDRGLRFFLVRNNSKANRCQITLDWNDTYSVRFYSQTQSRGFKELALHTGVYCDQLQDIFTKATGLYTSL